MDGPLGHEFLPNTDLDDGVAALLPDSILELHHFPLGPHLRGSD